MRRSNWSGFHDEKWLRQIFPGQLREKCSRCLGGVTGVLSDLLEVGLEGAQLEENRLMLQALQVDLAWRSGPPSLGTMPRQLPCSEEGKLAATFTPTGWAFLWELRQVRWRSVLALLLITWLVLTLYRLDVS